MVIWTSFPPPSEGVKVIQPSTIANIGNKESGSGTLYIAESRLSWVSDSGRGFSLEYPAISLHAISKDLSAFPHECLYVMIDSKFEDLATEETEQFADDADEEEEPDDITEIRFIPDDKSTLEALFQAMSECQALHPDPHDSVSDDDEEGGESGGEYYEEEVQPGGGAQGDGRYRNGSEPMDIGQFEDAEADADPGQ